MKKLIIKYKEIILYLIFGGLTTLVNIGAYYGSYQGLGLKNTTSNIIAWFASVLFAYITNKIFVFNSKTKDFREFIKELFSFFSCRFLTGIFDLVFMLITVDLMHFDTGIKALLMKVISNVVVIVANFILSKLIIFASDDKKKTKNTLEYILIIFASVLACSVLFYSGIRYGDDFSFHASEMYDLYLDLSSGNMSVICTRVLSFIGYGSRLYYAPLFHYTTVIIAILFKSYDLSLINAIKINIFIQYALSGIFMYQFIMRVTTGDKKAAIIGALIFVFWPYRGINAIHRSAYSELMAMTFIPFVFSQVYDIIKMKEYKMKPFMMLALGYSLMFISHTITATYTAIIVVIYILAHFKDIKDNIKKPSFDFSILFTILIMFLLVSFYLVPLTHMLLSKDYIISNQENMGAVVGNFFGTYDGLWNKSGFLTFNEFESSVDAGLRAILNVSLTVIILFVSYSLDLLYKKNHLNNIIRVLMVVMSIAVICFIYDFKIYVCAGAILFLLVYIASFNTESESNERLIKNKEYRLCIISLIVLMSFIIIPWLWFIVIKPLLNIQFAFRLYSFVSFFVAFLISNIIATKGLDYKRNYRVAILLFVCMAFSYSNNEAARSYEANMNVIELNDLIIDANLKGQGGWQHEYLPDVFRDTRHYESTYVNSLYEEVYNTMFLKNGALDVHFSPALLEGDAIITEENSTTYKVNAYNDSLIQIAKIYYDGYEIKLIDEEGNISYKDARNIDGLVSFSVNSGSYIVEVKYVGTKNDQRARYASIIALAATCIFMFVPIKKKKKDIV